MENWERNSKSKEDKHQMIFVEGELRAKPTTTVTVATLEGVALCPFCLFNAPVDKFVISLKSGFHKGLGKCPRCGNQSQWKTLKRQWTIKEFALWCYNYSCEGFWQKVKYKDFNEGLRARNLLNSFWTRYRELKGDDTDQNETYAEHIYRQQVEEAQAQGLTEA
jgi:hypothetical protein